MELSWYPCEKSIDCECMIYFWTLHSPPLVYMSILRPVPLINKYVYPYASTTLSCLPCSFVVSFEIRRQSSCSFSRLFWLLYALEFPVRVLRFSLSVSKRFWLGFSQGVYFSSFIAI